MSQQFVPVISSTGVVLMPTTNRKANKLLAKGRAIRGFDRGIFYIALLDREDGYTQPIAVGLDPGSKKEAITIKSAAHTYLNLQADAVMWVKDAEESSTAMRRARRYRKTPYRKCRPYRHQRRIPLPPSTKARWQLKLRICRWLARYYPVNIFVVEDVKAESYKGQGKQWNRNFSPIQVGKDWLYWQLGKIAPVRLVSGFETYKERQRLGLMKCANKMSDSFTAHCVDSWTLANLEVSGHFEPDNTALLYLVPLRFHRRQLHRLQPEKGGIRKSYGGTRSCGFKRGSWVQHPTYGVCYVGGTLGKTVSLHEMQTGKRLTQYAKPTDLKFLCTASWRIRKGEGASSVA